MVPLTELPQLLRPRALEPGDLVVIVALSGPLHARYAPALQQAVVELEGWDSVCVSHRSLKPGGTIGGRACEIDHAR